jgi:hypothetical protein
VNAGLAALSATAVVAAPALAVTHAQVQAPEVLRSATAIQLAADSSGLLTSAERVGQALVSSPVVIGVIGYSVAFGDQQTLADQLGAIADAPAWALGPVLGDQPQVTAALQSLSAGLKTAAASFTTKTPISGDNPAAALIHGSDDVATATWNALAASPQKLSKFVTDVSAGDNVKVYQDIKDALETPLGISKLVATQVNPGGATSTVRFGSLVTAVTNLNHGIETNLASALGVTIDSKTYDPVPAGPANKTNVVATSGAITPGSGISALNAKAQTPSQALSNVTKTFLPSKSARTQSLAGNETVKETGKGAGQEAGKGAGRHFSLGDHSRQAGDGKPSSPRHSVGKHRAAESGGK